MQQGFSFDKEFRQVSGVKRVSIKDVDDFVKRHYLGKRPAIVLLALVMLVDELACGCIVFSAPPRECNKRYGGETWELARLFIDDDLPKNSETWLISQGIKWIRKNHKNVKVLVSYADPSVGHSGTIYKASNWKSDGRTDEGRKTPRCDYYDARTGKKYGRRGNMPADAIVERRPRVSKWRFVMPLRSSCG
jgi:hypothetical protein